MAEDHQEYIYKTWIEERIKDFATETRAYNALIDTGIVPRIIFAGEIFLSGVDLQYGGIEPGSGILLEKVKGTTLSRSLINEMSVGERQLLRDNLVEAHRRIRECGMVLRDARPENVIWDGAKATIIDLEDATWSIQGILSSYEVAKIMGERR